MNLPMDVARRRLTRLWFGGAAVLFLVMLAASVHRQVDAVTDLWAWFLPCVVPTLSLIIGVFVADQLGRGVQIRAANAFLVNVTTGLSAFYLLLVLVTLVMDMIDYITLPLSQLYLAPVQGLVATALSAFFVQKDADERPNRRAEDQAPGRPGGLRYDGT